MRAHGDVIAHRDDVAASVLAGRHGIGHATDLLDLAERAAGAPLVDEAERHRLEQLAEGAIARGPHWHSLLARRDDVPVGYAGVQLPSSAGLVATGDVALRRDAPPEGPVLAVLLASLEALAWEHAAARLQVWLRQATSDDVARAAHEGYGVERRLAVLGRDLGDLSPADPPTEVRIRPFRPDEDDEGVVAVLRAAYAGSSESGWDLARFRERRSLPWFRPEDLLVAEAPADGQRAGWIAGLHWLKRRDPGVGEVYNLAIHPDAQGYRLGAALLAAGLAHLRDIGCRQVVLWVDLGNERAVRLYASLGFETRWEDLAFTRTLRGAGRR